MPAKTLFYAACGRMAWVAVICLDLNYETVHTLLCYTL
jgi:hypothetical protein